MPLKLNSAGGGSSTIDVVSTASNYTLTAPAVTGNIITSADSNTVNQTMISRSSFYGGFGPAFSATVASNQTVVAATPTKVALATEEFDTNACFDPTTNYRFTPNVAGYYQINVALYVTTGVTTLVSYIYKNGSVYMSGSRTDVTTASFASQASALIYMNGSTDYIEMYGYSSSTLFVTGTKMSGFLARPA
jgi:hypothetical protein